jgi:PAS domain S-box-containing protein
MRKKPIYEEPERNVNGLEQEPVDCEGAERTRWETKRLLQDIFDGIPDGISVLDPGLTIIRVNKWIEETHTDDMPVIGKKCYKVYQKRQTPCPWCPSLKSFSTGELQNEEVQVPLGDGSFIWIELSAYPIKDEHGAVAGVIEYVKEITERKKTEEALRESEERYRSFIENAPVGMFMINTRGEFIYGNRKLLEMTGYKKKDWLTKPFHSIIHPDDLGVVLEKLQKRIAGKGTTEPFEIRIYHASGKTLWIKIISESFYETDRTGEKRIVGIQSFVEDITERKQAEEALMQETEFRRVLGAIANEFITVSPASIDKGIDRALQVIGSFVKADRSYVILFDFQAGTVTNTHEWCKEGIDPQIKALQGLPIEMFEWVIDRLSDLQVVQIPKVADMPEEAMEAKKEFEAEGIQSMLLVPLVSKGTCIGTIGFDFVAQERICSEIEVRLLQMSGATLSNALDRKHAEEALLESEEKYRTILENIEDGYFEVDIAGNFTFFNDSVCRILGYSRDELVGMNNRQYTDEVNAKKLYSTFNKVFSTENPEKGFDWEIIRRNGDKRHVEASVSLRKDTDGQTIGFRGVARDVTERKYVEKVLENEKEKFRILVEESPLGVALIGGEGRYRYVNPKFKEIFGYSLEEIPTGREWFSKAFPDSSYRAQVISIWMNDKKKAEKGEPRVRKFSVTCKNGTKKTVNFRLVTMETGEQFVIYEDITGKELLEAKLQQAEKMEAIGALAGGVAHDLNNILAGIISYPELILTDLPKDSALRKPLFTIQKSGERAAVIVQDLLTLARRGVSISEVVNLNGIISDQMKNPEFQKLVSFHPHVQVETRFENDLLNIKGSATHLSKSIMNLVSNAAEAMPDGGKVLISTENRYVDTPLRGYDHIEQGEYATVTVSDTGIGISREDIGKIFEPFYTKKMMGRSGTGLGMAVVWGTVKDHKGYVEVESNEGKGTTFTLYFPVTI